MVTHAHPPARIIGTGLGTYTRCAQRSTARVIGQYSTSFGLATRLVDARPRVHIRNIYGLVRVADEIVDGAAAEAGVSPARQREILDSLESETTRAISEGYSANLVVHAFAATARTVGIGDGLVSPFFRSMRRDLDDTPLAADEVSDYIYGSAEVVGLMCLRVFLMGTEVSSAERNLLEQGARRLGSAFQKINFMRDIASDWRDLGRNYFPGLDPENISEADKNGMLDDIDDDLSVAARAIPHLPDGSRSAVSAAHELFAALSGRLRDTSAERLLRERVSVPTRHKLLIFVRALRGRAGRARA